MRTFDPAELAAARQVSCHRRGTLATHISRLHSVALDHLATAARVTKRAYLEGLIEHAVKKSEFGIRNSE